MAGRLAPTMTMSDMGDSVYGPAAKGRDHPIMLPDATLPQTAPRRSAGTRSSAVQGEARPAENGEAQERAGSGSAVAFEQLAPDQHAPDLVGAGADGIELGGAQDASGGVFIDVTVARSEEPTSEIQSLMRN